MWYIKVELNGRVFSFNDWADFAKATANVALTHTINILDIREPKGVGHVA